MSDCRSGPSALWCARADALFNVPGLHVLEVDHDDGRVVVTVESDQTLTGCPSCGVVAVAHGRRHPARPLPPEQLWTWLQDRPLACPVPAMTGGQRV